MQENAVFVAELSHLPEIMSWVREHIALSGCDDQIGKKIEVSLEEVFVNIISYAYEDHSGSIEVLVDITPSQRISFIIKDRGQPFNPTEHGTVIDVEVPIEQRSPGGLGIAFVKHFMDEILYELHGNYNVLTIKKNYNG